MDHRENVRDRGRYIAALRGLGLNYLATQLKDTSTLHNPLY